MQFYEDGFLANFQNFSGVRGVRPLRRRPPKMFPRTEIMAAPVLLIVGPLSYLIFNEKQTTFPRYGSLYEIFPIFEKINVMIHLHINFMLTSKMNEILLTKL